MNGISVIFPHAINPENDRVLELNTRMLRENTRGNYELLYLGNMRRPDLVYKGWNMLFEAAKYDLVLWANTDLLLAPDWDIPIQKLSETSDWISLRVVECGAIPSYHTMISKNFGWTAESFDRAGFENFVRQDIASRPVSEPGWVWYCPSIIKKSKWADIGKFAESPVFPHPQDIEFKNRAISAKWNFVISNHSYAYHLQRAQENLGKPDRIKT
mgnify:CR=1